MNLPIVALVGRPNVGKSTLFNRLAGEQLAIVDNTPGTTRDRIFSKSEWCNIPFYIIDTGGIDPSSNSQTPLSISSAEFIEQIRDQAQVAIEEADLILFITDAISGVVPADKEIADFIRSKQTLVDGKPIPPILLVVNKCDSDQQREMVSQFYELGLGDPYPISSIHGTETGDLLDAVINNFPETRQVQDETAVRIAIVGKPNVGKSSLLNRILGEERSIVSPIPGTTRDAIDTRFEFNDTPITLIDTAGIRRRGKIIPGVEKYSVVRSLRAIERAEVALLMIDAMEGINAQDTHIAGFIKEAWKSVVVLVNKWDLVKKDSFTMQSYTNKIKEELNFMDYVPIQFISAKTGQRVEQVLPLALQVYNESRRQLPTSALNRILRQAQDAHPAPSRTGKHLRIYYGTQVRMEPITFLVYVNDPSLAHFSYLRYLENRIRAEFPFIGTPIRLVLRPRR